MFISTYSSDSGVCNAPGDLLSASTKLELQSEIQETKVFHCGHKISQCINIQPETHITSYSHYTVECNGQYLILQHASHDE